MKTEPVEIEATESKMKDWEIKNAAEVLMEAKEIQADPEKMKAVKAYLEKTKGKADSILKEVGSIDELKEIRKQKMAKTDEE
jgi:hypothetical protein